MVAKLRVFTAAASCLLALHGMGWAATPAPGSVVTTDVQFDSDLVAPSHTGIVITVGADDITIDGRKSDTENYSIDAPGMAIYLNGHSGVTIKNLNKITVSAADAVDPAPVSKITGVTCNEDCDGDVNITGDLTVKLRAKRMGSGDGRVYTIAVECRDAAGNVSTATVRVTVPHDQGKKK